MEIRIPSDEPSKLIGLLVSLSHDFPEYTQELIQLTRSCPNGLTIEVLPTKLNHTDSQRRYYRKWCGEFAKFTGNTPDEMHEHMLSTTYGTEIVETRLGQFQRPVQRSSESSRTEYSELIETMIRIAANFGFVVPPAIRRDGEPKS